MTGVAYALNPLLHHDGLRDTRTVRGTKLVLVSAGAFGSPGILERSGIGAKDVLENVGVKQRVDLPGVGKNYQGFLNFSRVMTISNSFFDVSVSTDHNVLTVKYFAADKAQSIDAILRKEEGAIDGASFLFLSIPVRTL